MSETALIRELEICEGALAIDDFTHAAHHLAGALALAPTDARVRGLFESFADRVDVLAHVPDDGYFGHQLLRAFGLRHNGRVDDALVLAAQIAESVPHGGCEFLIADWLKDLHAMAGSLGADVSAQLARLLAHVASGTVGIHRLYDGERALLAGYSGLAAQLIECGTTRTAATTASGMLRRAGRFESALAAVESGARERIEFSLTQKGLTLRTMGDCQRAIEAFEAAQNVCGRSEVYNAEIARCHFVMGDKERAASILEAIVLTAGGNDQLERTLEACRASRADDPIDVLDRIRRDSPFPRLESPRDATMKLLVEHRDRFRPHGESMKMTIHGWEPPSNRLLVALYAGCADNLGAASYSMLEPKLAFDPLSQRRGTMPPLWAVRGRVVTQATDPPSIELRRAIARASAAPDFNAMWACAAEVARDVARNATDVAAALVHPPADPEFTGTLPEGLFHFQIAGACVLAAMPHSWKVNRDVFESLLFGPVDWTSAAAVIALGELARRDASAAREIRDVLVETIDDLVPHSCEPRFSPLMGVFNTLPCVPPEALAKLRAWFAAHVAEPPPAPLAPVAPKAAAVPPPPAPSEMRAETARADSLWKWLALAVVALIVIFLATR